MVKELFANGKYLNLPVIQGKDKELLTIKRKKSEDGSEEKVLEFLVSVNYEDNAKISYSTQIPIESFCGSILKIEGNLPQHFLDQIFVGDEMNHVADSETRPSIHFTADTGWTNDPNGMVYVNGMYHLFYQYNPLGLEWGNLSWGHAVSTDLLHWEQKDPVMFPDQDGMIFSGCAIKNERALLNLPKDAILFFYTAAGGIDEWGKNQKYVQKIAYSLDGGETLIKIDEPCVPFLYKDSRDPKVFWHEETQAYIMVLWTKGNDFGILRSADLMHWELTEEVTLENGWECPDLFQLRTENGDTCWFFWSADGFYYDGTFDGFHFETDGKKHNAYLTSIPYAAQTFSGIENRVISIPWLRIKNDGRRFTGSYGIPVELFCKKTQNGWCLMQKPVKEFTEHASRMTELMPVNHKNRIFFESNENAIAIEVTLKEEGEIADWKINGIPVVYIPSGGIIIIDNQAYHVRPNQKKLLFIIDDRILEVFFERDGQLGTFELRNNDMSIDLNVSGVASWDIYEIK